MKEKKIKKKKSTKSNKTNQIPFNKQTQTTTKPKFVFLFLLKHSPYFCNPFAETVKPQTLNSRIQEFKKIKREQSIHTSQMPLTRYPKKNPDEQMRNCCHLGLSESEIPNKLRACSSFFITPLHRPKLFNKKSVFLELKPPTSLKKILFLHVDFANPEERGKKKRREFWLLEMQNLVD